MANERNYTDDTDYSLDSILNEDFGSDESFSLESILAEYKSDAFMEGDKPTPSDELQRKTDDILREVLGREPSGGRTAPAPQPQTVQAPQTPQTPQTVQMPQAAYQQPRPAVQPQAAARVPDMPAPPVRQQDTDRAAVRQQPEEPVSPYGDEDREPPKRQRRWGRKKDRDDYDEPEDTEPEDDDYYDDEEDVKPKKRRFSLFRGRRSEPEPEEEDGPVAPLLEEGAVEPPTGPAYNDAPEIDQSVFEEPNNGRGSFDTFFENLRREHADQEHLDDTNRFAAYRPGSTPPPQRQQAPSGPFAQVSTPAQQPQQSAARPTATTTSWSSPTQTAATPSWGSPAPTQQSGQRPTVSTPSWNSPAPTNTTPSWATPTPAQQGGPGQTVTTPSWATPTPARQSAVRTDTPDPFGGMSGRAGETPRVPQTPPETPARTPARPVNSRWEDPFKSDKPIEEFSSLNNDGPKDYSAHDTDEFVREVEETLGVGEDEEIRDEEPRRRGIFGLFSRRSRDQEPEENGDWDGEDWEDREDDGDFIDDDGYFDEEPEPDFKFEASRFAAKVPSLRIRLIGAVAVTALMVLSTLLFCSGKSALFGMGTDPLKATGGLLIMELIVIALGIDVMIRGLEDILTFSAGAESLVFISCLLSVLDGFSMLIRGSFDAGLPMAAVSAVSLVAAMSSRKAYYMAVCDSLKSSRAASVTFGVTVDREDMEHRNVLKKVTGAGEGFYTKLTSPDISEELYSAVSPLLILASFVFSFVAGAAHGDMANFGHSFSIMAAVCASFPATALFALPFRYAASSAKKAGGSIAGYEGARDIYYSDGALITDVDLFPVGSVSLSGMKVFEGVSQPNLITCAGSLIIASDSGLRKVFEELLRTQGLIPTRVEEFACYDGGGIGGVVDGQRVLAGTGAFMNLMGIRVPDDLNSANSVFCAINDELAGVFSLNYIPANSVQTALVSLLATNTNLLMAVRDFNVTPNTVKQKFKVSMDGVEYLPVETTYDLSSNVLPQDGRVSAILCRGGLAPFAEVITRGRLLKLITELNTLVTAVGTVMSLVIMFILCWAGAYASASVKNVLLFMSIFGIAVYIMSQAVRRRIK